MKNKKYSLNQIAEAYPFSKLTLKLNFSCAVRKHFDGDTDARVEQFTWEQINKVATNRNMNPRHILLMLTNIK